MIKMIKMKKMKKLLTSSILEVLCLCKEEIVKQKITEKELCGSETQENKKQVKNNRRERNVYCKRYKI